MPRVPHSPAWLSRIKLVFSVDTSAWAMPSSSTKRDKPLLGAVMQVSLDPAADLITRRDSQPATPCEFRNTAGRCREPRSWPAMSLTASSRSVVNAPRMRAILQQQQRPAALPRLRMGSASFRPSRQQVDIGEIRVAGKRSSRVASSTTKGFISTTERAQHRHRHHVFAPAAAERDRACRRRRMSVVARACGLCSTGVGGRRWRQSAHREVPRPPRVQAIDAGVRAQRLPTRKIAEQVLAPTSAARPGGEDLIGQPQRTARCTFIGAVGIC